MEAEKTERSIKDMIREKPDAFNFEDITEIAPGKASAGTSATLTQILGGFTYFGRDEITGTKFWGRKPKLKTLERLSDMFKAAGGSTESSLPVAQWASEIVGHLLFVQTADGWRSATIDEIKEAFDLEEVTEAMNRFSGMILSGNTEGNAPIHPTTEKSSA